VKKVTTVLVDDIDGSPADETIVISLNRESWEIDLSNSHADQLRSELYAWTQCGRKISHQRPRASKNSAPRRMHTATSIDKTQARNIRLVLRDAGYPVSSHGRLSAVQLERYEAIVGLARDMSNVGASGGLGEPF
jgi:hypothetical protein